MSGSAKIAISVDAELLRQLEHLRRRTGESRSAAIGRAIRLLTHAEEQARRAEEYRSAYQRNPESEAEIVAASTSARRSLRGAKWKE